MIALVILLSVVALSMLVTRIARVRVRDGSPLAGRTLGDTDLPQDERIVILGIEREDGSYRAVPTPEDRIDAGDSLIAYGSEEGLERLGGGTAGSGRRGGEDAGSDRDGDEDAGSDRDARVREHRPA